MQPQALQPHSMHDVAVNGGSATAIGGGLTAALFGVIDSSNPALVIAYAGLATSLAGLFVAFSNQLFQWAKWWLEVRKVKASEKADRERARAELESLLVRLDAKKERIATLEVQSERDRERIAFLETLVDHNNKRLNDHQATIDEHSQAIDKASSSGIIPIIILPPDKPA